MNDIEASANELLRQAPMTAGTYLCAAQTHIDGIFGAGYAKKHPALVVAFMQAASADFNHAILKLAAQDIRDGLRDVAAALERE